MAWEKISKQRNVCARSDYAIRFAISNAKDVGRGVSRIAVYFSAELVDLFGLAGRRVIPMLDREEGLIAFEPTDSDEGFKLSKNNSTAMVQFQITVRIDEIGYWVGAERSRVISFDDLQDADGLIVFAAARVEPPVVRGLMQSIRSKQQQAAARRTVSVQ